MANDNVMTFDHIMTAYYSAQSYHWDASAHVPYLSFGSAHRPEGCDFVSYDDERITHRSHPWARTHPGTRSMRM